jgi:hypothetical protein
MLKILNRFGAAVLDRKYWPKLGARRSKKFPVILAGSWFRANPEIRRFD